MLTIVNSAYIILLLVNISYSKNIERRKHTAEPLSSDFNCYTLVQPKIYDGRERRHISSTLQNNGKHLDHVQIDIDGINMTLDLVLNKQLISKGFLHHYQESGKRKTDSLSPDEIELCQYSGKVRGKHNSWVAISTCDGLSGVIFDGTETHYIEQNTRIMDEDNKFPHYLYKQSDMTDNNANCGYKGSSTRSQSRYKRRAEEEAPKIRGPYSATQESKYVELVLVFDNKIYQQHNQSHSKIVNYAKSIANIVNSIYSQLNIFIALVGVVTWTENDEITFSSDGDVTLSNFLQYRREKLNQMVPNDNAQLITNIHFDNGVNGKALKGPICTQEYSGGVATDRYFTAGQLATVVAHLLGHNFGMEHDTDDCKCPQDHCIMSPKFLLNVTVSHWSSCSIQYLLNAFNHGMDYCLRNKPKSLFDSPTCGNGFVEPGEQCDCGLQEHCDNYCCDATSCKLHSNATCATGECCDLITCQPKNAGTLCRSTDLECDLPEYCDGQSEYCPEDTYKLDGGICESGEAFCYQGFCKSRTDQCKLLWGITGNSSVHQCYQLNTKGTRHGNCGYNVQNRSYLRCEPENILCGLLQCQHLNERLEFGLESVSILSTSFINIKGTVYPCRNAIVDLGDQMNVGLVPNGAKCAEGKMCVNQKCVAVSEFTDKGSTCPNACNGNGWCNNKGHCHCKEGFAPPDCRHSGLGGSIDSGSPQFRSNISLANETNLNETLEEESSKANCTSFVSDEFYVYENPLSASG